MVYLYNVFPKMFGLMSNWAASQANGTVAMLLLGLACILCAVVAYLLGSLNSAIIVSKYKFKQDIRSFGSGNAGLTNMHRVYGKDGAIYTLIGDIAKQIISVFVGILLLGQTGAYLAGLFCMLGHIFPIYYKFKGGKGVLTAATMILCIDPMIFAVLIVIFALVLLLTRYVSLSSIIAAICYPAAVYYAAVTRTGQPPQIFVILFAVVVGAIVIFMHRTNLYRLFNNQESKFSFKKKEKKDDNETK